MKTIRFEDKFYNGAITPYAVCFNAVEFSVENGEPYVTIEQEHYLTENEGHKTKLLKGKAKLADITYDWKYADLGEIAKSVKANYKKEFYIDDIPYCLSYKKITIDGKDFKFDNYSLKDSFFNEACEYVDTFCKLVSVPSKLLEKVLSHKPFQKIK